MGSTLFGLVDMGLLGSPMGLLGSPSLISYFILFTSFDACYATDKEYFYKYPSATCSIVINVLIDEEYFGADYESIME